MKRKNRTGILWMALMALLLYSCNEGRKAAAQMDEHDIAEIVVPEVNSITPDFRTWWNYHYEHIRLSRSFQGQDADGKPLSRKAFVNNLTTGRYIPLLVGGTRIRPVYRLAQLDGLKHDIRKTISEEAKTQLEFLDAEGRPFPEFKFTDIEGNILSSENTKGKLMLVKCWFIKCVACVEEFPELNQLVKQYEDKNDMVFMSLALDSKDSLQPFLRQNPLAYHTIADMAEFTSDKLFVYGFPTHFLVDREGKIYRKSTDIEDIKMALVEIDEAGIEAAQNNPG